MPRLRELVAAALTLSLIACAPAGDRRPAQPAASPVATAPDQPPPPPATPLPPERSALRIIAVGDIMLGTDFPDDRTPPPDHPGILAPVAGLLASADLTFGNLEGVLMDAGEPVKRCDDPSLCFLFRTPTRMGPQLVAAGFDVLSLANNHARDFGEVGRDASMRELDALGIAHTGRAGDLASLRYDDLRVAVAAFAPHPGSWDLLDVEAAVALVRGLDVSHDLVLVSFHGGGEGVDAQRLPDGPETFHGQPRGDLRRFAHAVIDAGADLVVGHGPHVPRALEGYRGRVIAYSLGNFATHWGISVSGVKGYAPILDVTLARDGSLIEGRVHAAIQRRPDGVFPDAQGRSIELMRELSASDVPDSGIVIASDGSLVELPR